MTTATINETLTANEKELLELINSAENPAKMVDFFISIMSQNSITYKLIMLMTENYKTVAEFAEAINMSEQETFDIMTGNTEPTLTDVIKIAEALKRDPAEVSQIFIDYFAEQENK